MHINNHGVIIALKDKKPIGILTERDLLYHIDNQIDTKINVSSVYTQGVITINYNRSIEYGLHVLIDNNIRRLVVIDDNGDFIGVVTQEMLINHLDNDTFKIDIKVSSLLNSKQNIITIKKDSDIAQAIKLMNRHNVGSIVVVDKDNTPIGIFTERNIVSVMDEGIDKNLNITKIMSSPVISANENDKLYDIVATMKDKNIRRVLIMDNDSNIVGIVGTRDIVQNLKGNYG